MISVRGGRDGSLQFVVDTDTLDQFALAGKKPYEIVVEKGTVGVKYFKGDGRYSALALWEDTYSSSGEPIRVLKITYGTYGWRILCRGESSKDDKTKPDG